MPREAAPGGAGWLTLQEASGRLDVHPATLRQWADRGRVRSYRTPGGHRRFSAEDVEALATALSTRTPDELDLLQNAALGRARRELSAGRLAGESWYRLLDPAARDRYRQAGRELLRLLTRWLAPGADAQAVLAEARGAAREQGDLALRGGLTTAEVLRAHACFRDMLIETVLQMSSVQDQSRAAHDLVGRYRQVGAFLDEVLLTHLDAFRETSR